MSLETIKGNVRAMHAGFGFEKKVKEFLEGLIKEVQYHEKQIEELQKEIADLKAAKK